MNIQPERTEYDHHFALALIAMARADWIGAQEELSLAADSLYKFSAQQNSFEQNVTKGWLYDIIRELKRIELHNNNQAARAKMEGACRKKAAAPTAVYKPVRRCGSLTTLQVCPMSKKR